jgi:lysophospholipase L1-like esterase
VTVDPDSVGSQRAPRSMWYKFGALALVYLGLWLLVELAGRIYIAVDGMPLTSTLASYQNDDVLGYRPNPGFKLDDLRFNRQGFRGDIEYSDHPTPGVTRILAVGGSTTFGTGGATADAYPHRLQEDLRAQCTPVEVINAGVSGWQILQISHMLPTFMGSAHPHWVLISSCWNTGLKPQKYYRNEDFVTYPLFQYSLLFRLLDRRLRNVGWSLHYHPFLHTREEARVQQEAINADPVVFDRYEEYIRSSIENVRAGGGEPIFLVPPGNLPDSKEHPTAYFTGTEFAAQAPNYELMCLAVNRTRNLSAERILSVGRDLEVTVIDARRLFDNLSDARRRGLFYDELHLNPDGNARLAQFLASQLCPLISKRGPSRGEE